MIYIITAGSNDECSIQTVVEGTLPKSGRELWDEFVRELEKPIGPEPKMDQKSGETRRLALQRWYTDRHKLVEEMCKKHGVKEDTFCEARCFIEHLKKEYGVWEPDYEEIWTEE